MLEFLLLIELLFQPVPYRELRYAWVVGQADWYTCGPSAVATLLTHYYGIPTTEAEALELAEGFMVAAGREPGQAIATLAHPQGRKASRPLTSVVPPAVTDVPLRTLDRGGGAAPYNQGRHHEEVVEMTRWMKVSAVALAAVVGVVPAFSQLTYAQAIPTVPEVPLPKGNEVPDAELLEVEGQWLLALLVTLLVGALVGWLSYYHGGRDPLQAAIEGAAAMIIFTLGIGLPAIPR